MTHRSFDIMIVGAGLAGSEAAWQAAQRGVRVRLYDMRPHKLSPAHHTDKCAELVCSNSFRSDDHDHNAVGLLHEEMRRCGSLIMACADRHQVPAGSALAVDRERFSDDVTAHLANHPNIEIIREEVCDIPSDCPVIIATGPLTSDGLSARIAALTGARQLAFFDAIAPIVYKDSVDFSRAWMQSRYDKAGLVGDGADYINCPMDEAQYNAFVDALLSGEVTPFKTWEAQAPMAEIEATPYFDACLPIEVMAARGRETLRHGPMKPVGLTNAHAPDVKPYAVVQLRQDNALGTLYNMVGFQTKLKYGAQSDIFRMIPGLEKAEFARLGGIHRNSYINSPKLLDSVLRLKSHPNVRFAGQISGCEGYVESASVGLMAGRFVADDMRGQSPTLPPTTTALGALLVHITVGHLSSDASGGSAPSFQPMNINFGLFPPISRAELTRLGVLEDGAKLPRGRAKRGLNRTGICRRALQDIGRFAG